MGELEQARPIIDALRRRLPTAAIAITLYSPSAREHVSAIPGADLVSYLPFDSWFQARRFIRLIQPDVLLLIRHDIWPNHLWQARRSGTRTILVDASTRSGSASPNHLVRALNKAALSFFDQILAVDDGAAEELRRLSRQPDRVHVIGDTRYDRVLARALERPDVVDALATQLSGRWVVVAGSTWPSDEECLLPAFRRLHGERKETTLVLVPHEPTADRLRQIGGRLRRLGLAWSTLTKLEETASFRGEVLVIDRIGLLANLYALASVAFVGGGFGPGIHSVLEPAVHALPVLFGSRIENSAEAVLMAQSEFATAVTSAEEIYRHLHQYLRNAEMRRQHGAQARRFVENRLGASERIAAMVAEGRLMEGG